jgi:hypothetical protein
MTRVLSGVQPVVTFPFSTLCLFTGLAVLVWLHTAEIDVDISEECIGSLAMRPSVRLHAIISPRKVISVSQCRFSTCMSFLCGITDVFSVSRNSSSRCAKLLGGTQGIGAKCVYYLPNAYLSSTALSF